MADQALLLRQTIDHIPTPSVQPPVQGRFRHQPLPLQSPRTSGLSTTDDAFTTMGRRVVAREQAARRRSLGRTDTLPADDQFDTFQASRPSLLPATVQAHESRARLIAREAELQAVQVRQLRQEAELQALEARRLRQELSEIQLQSLEARRASQAQIHLASPTSPGGASLWRQEPFRRRRIPRGDTQTSPNGTRSTGSGSGAGTTSTLNSEQSRLSILSGSLHDIQNFASPASATGPSLPLGPRPLIFDEPENWVESPRATLDNADLMVDEVSAGRSYLVRRRITPEGSERVQSVTMPEWSDADVLGIYAPRTEASTNEELARRRTIIQAANDRRSQTRSSPSPVNYSTPERRRWVRLDADGNEVLLNEEQELERARMELRLRRARDAPSLALLFDPDGGSPRSQWYRAPEGGYTVDPTVVAYSDPYDVAATDDVEHKDYLPRRWDPLPMALHEMVVLGKRPRGLDDDVAVVVDSLASFAGR
ncbi:hypothetical protein NMY22_g15843 [Coprinellus aureogranulatus]|nr:hypothetical protein NMY22_g15843 [Coprinellus aureogranulatus]